jgi:hypothetical protein
MANCEKYAKVTRLALVSDFLLIINFIYLAFPTSIVYQYYTEGKSPEYPLIAVFEVFFVIELIVHRSRLPKYSIALIICGLGMCILGIYKKNYYIDDGRWFIIDILEYSGMFCGIIWAKRRTSERICKVFSIIALACFVLLIINIVGLYTGVLDSLSPASGRLYTFSLFNGANILTCTMSYYIFNRMLHRRHISSWLVIFMTVCIVICAAFISSTRSVLLALVAGLLFLIPIMFHEAPGSSIVKIIIIGMIALSIIVILSGSTDYYLFQRFKGTDLAEESRFIELQMMFDQFRDGLILGEGFGSYYNVLQSTSPTGIAFAPHIGLFAFLQKGGVFVFILGVVLPIALTARVMLMRRYEGLRYRFLMIIGLYVVTSSLSGGWRFFQLFLYGSSLWVSVLRNKVKTRESHTSVRKSLGWPSLYKGTASIRSINRIQG